MLTKQIVLTNPKIFQLSYKNIPLNDIIIKPLYWSICKADIKYYNGDRPLEILKQKLPLVLIHEAIGEIIYSNNFNYKKGEYVCLIPIKKHNSILDEYNYDYVYTKFAGSNYNGFMQQYISVNVDNIIKIVPKIEYTTLEIGSIIFQSIQRLQNKNFKLKYYNQIAIIGTGSLALWAALIYKEKYQCQVDIIGRHEDKLRNFDFVDNIYSFDNYNKKYDLIIEAVGYDSDNIFNKSINNLKNCGIFLILGVNENNVSINIRKMMEKGISIITSHRSTKYNFQQVIELIRTSKLIKNNLKNIISNYVVINNINDIITCFEHTNKYQFKTIMKVGKIWIN